MSNDRWCAKKHIDFYEVMSQLDQMAFHHWEYITVKTFEQQQIKLR